MNKEYHIFQQEFTTKEEMATEFFKAHYFRPDGADREWETYKDSQIEEERQLAHILSLIEATGTMIFMYHNTTQELTIVIPFNNSDLIDHNKILEDLRDNVLNGECLQEVEIVGCQAPYKLIYNEQY